MSNTLPDVFDVRIEDAFFYGTLVLFPVVETVWELYLQCRQLRICETGGEIPEELRNSVKPETYEKSRLYSLDILQYRIVISIFELLNTAATFGSSLLYGHWENAMIFATSLGYKESDETAVTLSFVFLISVMSAIVDIPFSFYYTFVIENRYGFNRQSVAFFVFDHLKNFVVSQLIVLPLIAGMIYVVKSGGDYFFLWLWGFSCLSTVLMLTIYPAYITPLFDNFVPLPVGPLRTSIEELARSQHFPLEQLYVLEGSKRSTHSNAYFTGLFGSIRIVIYDTLLYKVDADGKESGFKDQEVLAVIAHELGHWQNNHLIKRICIFHSQLLLTFSIFGKLFNYGPLYEAVGFPPNLRPVLIGLIAVQLIMQPLSSITGYLMNIHNRNMEYQADEYSVRLGYGRDLKSALCTLQRDNLSYPLVDWMYSQWYRSHPSILERIRYINYVERTML